MRKTLFVTLAGAMLLMIGTSLTTAGATLTSYGLDGPPCDPVEVPAGKVLFGGPHAHHSHLVHNQGAEALQVTVLYFNLAPGQAGAVDAERPKECPADLN